MSNGNIFREIKNALKDDPSSISPATLNRLVLEGIIGLKEELDNRPIFSATNMTRLEKHEVTLYGDSDHPGHEKRVSKLEDQMSTLIRILWLVVTPLLVAIGGGMVILIKLSLGGG